MRSCLNSVCCFRFQEVRKPAAEQSEYYTESNRPAAGKKFTFNQSPIMRLMDHPLGEQVFREGQFSPW